MLKKWIALLLPALALVGCIHDDYSECGVLRLEFQFTNNEDDTDRLNSYIRDIRIYKFNSEGWLVEVIHPSPGEISQGWMEILNPAAGEFTFSVWASSATEIGASGFMEVEMDDAATSRFRPLMDDDQTRLDDFFMMLDHNALPDPAVLGDVAPKSQNTFADLYHDSANGVKIVKGVDRTVDFDFVRNSNVLDVTVVGTQHLPTRAAGDAPVKIFSVGRNGRYKWNNEIDKDARLVRYESPTNNVTETTLQTDIKSLRFDEVRHSDDPIMLHLTDPATGKDLMEPLDVIRAIVNIKDAQGNFVYNSQEDIDREYEFPIRIELDKDLNVRIFISEWELVTPGVIFE